MEHKLEITADGSHTLFVPALEEHYHSVNGARGESLHVFIKHGLKAIGLPHVRIFEVGFGTGLNALLTAQFAKQNGISVAYTAIEKYPLENELTSRLNYSADAQAKTLFEQLHNSPWESTEAITPTFSLHKIKADLTEFHFSGSEYFHLVYFDAFAPDKQPEMWNSQIFSHLHANMQEGGILVTYCAKGIIRRQLQEIGFRVERLPGPPGKREMIRATKQAYFRKKHYLCNS